MNVEEIRALAEVMRNNGLSALEWNEEAHTLKMKRAAEAPVAAAPVFPAVPVPAAPAAPRGLQPMAMETPVQEEPLSGTPVKSPMVGVFYDAPAPGAKPFIQIGDKVKKGDVLCVIEAMKLFNEIVAETEGRVSEICCKNGQVVEFGQALMTLKP